MSENTAKAPQLHDHWEKNKERRKNAQTWQKPLVIASIGLALVFATVLSYYWFVWSEAHVATDNAYLETDIFPVNSRILGFVKTILVHEGQLVKKGQPLLELDNADVLVELSVKKAKYKKAEADFRRAQRLFKTKAISKSDLETAEANLALNKADLQGSMLKLRYTEVVAANDGVIAKQNTQPGQFVQPGQSLFVLVPSDRFWIKANYKETQLKNVRVGQPVKVKFDAFPDQTWTGHVTSIFPSSGARLSLLPPENATGNFTKIVQRIPVLITLDQKRGIASLRSGMSAETTILVDEK